ncbi:MAG: N-acetylneuraminate synthase family protein [Spirochaetales bacterium]|nr:N-acetylneuraminate synthase family protein [Spirochaetales bacterium]
MITAELGTAHGGSLKKAVELIHAARDAGADCVKFQWVIAKEILHPLTGRVELPGGSISLYSCFEALEQPPAFYHSLKEETEKAGLIFLCSPFGSESLKGLIKLGCRDVKIASPELNHYPLLKETQNFSTVILSTGVSKLTDIEKAVQITGDSTLLLHCITSYPAPEEEYNLRTLPFLAGRFNLPVGVSDHSLGPTLIPCLAVTQGAVFIEKHFTLSREDGGLDDPIALTPPDFATMVENVRKIEQHPQVEAISLLKEEWGDRRVERILGRKEKKIAPSEAENYNTTNRSIHALREIAPEEELTNRNMAILRTEKNLSTGLFPEHWEALLGRRAKKRIPSGEGILFDYLED